MQILAFDTAAAACSAALWRDGTVRARRLEPMARGQAEALLPMVRAVLDEAGAAFADLDLLAVTVGPGAFTGLRIGLAAARGLALATGLPCLGVTTLEAVAQAVPAAARTGDAILAVLDTRRDDVYAQTFGNDLNPWTRPGPWTRRPWTCRPGCAPRWRPATAPPCCRRPWRRGRWRSPPSTPPRWPSWRRGAGARARP